MSLRLFYGSLPSLSTVSPPWVLLPYRCSVVQRRINECSLFLYGSGIHIVTMHSNVKFQSSVFCFPPAARLRTEIGVCSDGRAGFNDFNDFNDCLNVLQSLSWSRQNYNARASGIYEDEFTSDFIVSVININRYILWLRKPTNKHDICFNAQDSLFYAPTPHLSSPKQSPELRKLWWNCENYDGTATRVFRNTFIFD